MTKKRIIVLSIISVLVLLVVAAVWIDRDREKILKGDDSGTTTSRLDDPDLLYYSSIWSGMCGNSRGEEGGCSSKIYFYSNGKFVKESGWSGADNKTEIVPTVEKQLGLEAAEQIKSRIKDSGLMAKNCPSREIMDAGWQYQINLDGTKKSFSDPAKECQDIFDELDKTINSAADKIEEEVKSQAGSLGSHDCISKFRVDRGVEYTAPHKIFQTDLFQSFRGGAFFGKIKDFQPGQNKQFADFINQLMREQKVSTYEHLWADVCFYRQDLLNPENGANLNYYIEHYYCTNSCQTGEYEIRVNLDEKGNFVGYREGKVY